MGIHPDLIVARCNEPLEDALLKKIAMFCNVRPDCVIENRTLPILYEAPLMLERQGFSAIVCRELGLETPAPDLADWAEMVQDPVLATALMDRILHHARCFSLRGESYRLKHPELYAHKE